MSQLSEIPKHVSEIERELASVFPEAVVIKHLRSGKHGAAFCIAASSEKSDLVAKVLLDQEDPDEVRRFQNECWALKELTHPSIPKFVEVGELSSGRPFFAMSKGEGVDQRTALGEQERLGGTKPWVVAMRITESILQVLAYMDSRQPAMAHRDIKDANILSTHDGKSVTVLDFGYIHSEDRPNNFGLVLAEGAMRYSPPSKLKDPQSIVGNQDVFSAGVLLYRLLTNEWPWPWPDNASPERVREIILNADPQAVLDRNSMVPEPVSKFVAKLLITDDSARPTPREALAEARRALSAERTPLTIGGRRLKFPHVIRDAIHGDIRMTDYEWQLMRSHEFQRLRGFKQLGFANLVYPGAEHTRFAHSLGTMYVADRMLRAIEEIYGYPVTVDQRQRLRAFALVHDVTHIAYGHTLEDELGFFQRHDVHMERIDRLFSPASQIGEVLRASDIGRDVLEYITSTALSDARVGKTEAATGHPSQAFREILEGVTGADVIDYLERDSYYCGLDDDVDTAIYRINRFYSDPLLQEEASLIPSTFGQHGYRADKAFAVESLLRQRFAMFMKVYSHRSKIAASAMLGKALTLAGLGLSSRLLEESYEQMSDYDVLSFLKSRGGPELEIAERLQDRALYVEVYVAHLTRLHKRHPDEVKAFLEDKQLLDPYRRNEIESQLAKVANIAPHRVVVYVAPKAPGYRSVSSIKFQVSPEETKSIGELQHPINDLPGRHLELWTIHVFAVIENRTQYDRLKAKAQALFHLSSETGDIPKMERTLTIGHPHELQPELDLD